MSSTQVSVDPATEAPGVASVPYMDARQSGSSPDRVLAGVVIAAALVALLVWLGTEPLISAQALQWVLRG